MACPSQRTELLSVFIVLLALVHISQGQARTCPTGEAPLYQGGPCWKCDKGKYATVDEGGNSICAPCPYNTFTDTTGATKCTPCPDGLFTSSSIYDRCYSCETDKVPVYRTLEEGGVRCEDCPEGTYTPNYGVTSCTSCPGGSYLAYDSYFSLGSCRECPIGTASTKPKAQKCYYGILYGCCSACEPGRFAPAPGSPSCQLCPAGTYQPEYGAGKCLPCPAGSFGPQPGAAACLLTRLGYYQDEPGQTIQKKCPEGTTSFVDGGKSVQDACKRIRYGRFRYNEVHRFTLSAYASFSLLFYQSYFQSDQQDTIVEMASGTTRDCSGVVLDSLLYCSGPVCNTYNYLLEPETIACKRMTFYALEGDKFVWIVESNTSYVAATDTMHVVVCEPTDQCIYSSDGIPGAFFKTFSMWFFNIQLLEAYPYPPSPLPPPPRPPPAPTTKPPPRRPSPRRAPPPRRLPPPSPANTQQDTSPPPSSAALHPPPRPPKTASPPPKRVTPRSPPRASSSSGSRRSVDQQP